MNTQAQITAPHIEANGVTYVYGPIDGCRAWLRSNGLFCDITGWQNEDESLRGIIGYCSDRHQHYAGLYAGEDAGSSQHGRRSAVYGAAVSSSQA